MTGPWRNKLKAINQSGKHRILVSAIVFVALFGMAGTYFILTSKAASPADAPLAACTVSKATGAGTPTNTVNVGVPIAGGGDSSAEIQNAINSASSAGGGKVVLQAGTYYIARTITVKSGIDFTGAAMNSTTIMATPAVGATPVVQTSGNSNITIESMTINQDGSAQTTRSLIYYLLDLEGGSNIIVQHVATRNPSTYSIVAHDGITGFCIRDNDVEDTNSSNNFRNLDGIHTIHAFNGDILDNYVDQMADGQSGDDGIALQVAAAAAGPDAGDSSNIMVAGNVVRGGATAGDFAFSIDGGYTLSGITIKDNEFWGGPDGMRDANFNGGGTLSNVTIIDNISHNNTATSQQFGLPQRGFTLPFGPGITLSNIIINGWYWCDDAGGAPVPSSGTFDGVEVSGVVHYTNCTDSPSTTTPPAVYPPQ